MKKLLLIALFITGLLADSIPVEISNRGSNWWTERAFLKNNKDLLISPIRILNTGNKTIKNISIEINAYNKQDSILAPYVGNKICKLIDPIKPKKVYKNNMKCGTYYKEHIEYLTIQAIYVEYMDGTINSSPSKLYKFSYNYEKLKQRSKYTPWISGLIITLVWSHYMVP
tara:strand:- start:81 stop:590 length:510 start_codon:yes stop_codon:yes gene_type:complete